MESNGTFRTFYASTTMMLVVVVGLLVIQGPMFTVNGNDKNIINVSDEVSAKKYTNEHETTAASTSSENTCSLGSICGAISPVIQADGSANSPINSQLSNSGQQGPKGEQGEQGPPGPTQELQVRQVMGDPVTIASGQEADATASCDADELVTGGGFAVREESESNVINLPELGTIGTPLNTPTTWNVVVDNPGPEEITIEAVAECAKLVDAQ